MLKAALQGKVNFPPSQPEEHRVARKLYTSKHDIILTTRYPDTGPLNINSIQKFLESSKVYFLAHYGKCDHSKVGLSDFMISHELGHGTFGNVVLAEHVASNTKYAVKIVQKEKLVKLRTVDQALLEKNIMQGLNSPFTIYLAYFFMDNSYLYFVLPYVQGGELFSYLIEVGRLKEENARFYLSQVILGLEYLHNLDLVYRDLKPENILLDHTGYLKLVDFGFSKVVKSQRTYTLCGTPEYMSPEMVLNKGHGPAADWWATGVLVYELVAGYTPFHHRSNMRIYEKIVTNSYEMSDRFTEPLKDLIKNLLQFETSKRLGNLKGGIDDIKNHKWFRATNWLAVLNRTITPEYVPDTSEMDTKRKPAMSLVIESKDRFAAYFNDFIDH